MSKGENMLERVARVIYPAAFADYERRFAYEMGRSGDPVAAKSFADHYDARGSAFVTARAVIEALMAPTPETIATVLAWGEATDADDWSGERAVVELYQAFLRTSLSKPNDEGEGK